MSNARRWKEFITWWEVLHINPYDKAEDLANKIEEIQQRNSQ